MTSPASVPASAPTPSPFRLGFLAFVEHGGVSGATSQGLQDGIDLFRHADELGFDTGWVRHRHLEKYLSSPLTFLSVVAQHTEGIRLGTSVTPLRFENPVRLAEEAATADLLTGGRLEVGLSSGYAQSEGIFGPVYGAITGSLREEADARLASFRSALRGDTLAVADASFPAFPAGTPLTAQPLSPTLSDRLYYGAGATPSAVRTGRQGLRLQLSTLNTEPSDLSFEEAQLESITAYRAAHASVTERPSYALVGRQVLPILGRDDAEEFAWLIERDEERQRDYGTSRAALPFQFGRVPSGDPDAIIEALLADVAFRGSDELVIALPFDHPPAGLHRILTAVAERIAPALGWTPRSD
ncbi:LLM class flavin-dependent oxidoreductase [Cryobacterium zhongshanensis]|uniref:LLM class flavin-dependent oxidoreductase n=1 Tax=Cryobacterium zhongshanensis TaxID=2928153 RepID=A0AA41QXS5_9MICO|nr:LLM class flavin-dependent oxidoreductase [Cryobacterium zhongshanensis]MCI4658804.1 LLM class flavin-dependent oxidoreductase [Cryobacterium zhongshanensis]